jgi:hypothetical protein
VKVTDPGPYGSWLAGLAAMAFVDDRDWLVAHIRHCFITSDESGLCERVIGPDEQWERLFDSADSRKPLATPASPLVPCESGTAFGSGNDVTPSASPRATSPKAWAPPDATLPPSFDIHCSLNYDSSQRRRSNTEQRLDKMKKDKSQTTKTKTVVWRDDVDHAYDPDEMGHLFEKKTLPVSNGHALPDANSSTTPIGVSSLSRLLAEVENTPNDPFFEFAQFDGAAMPGIPVKKMAIFLMMCSGLERWQPLYTTVQCRARVADLIGLICHHYVQQGKSPLLKNETTDGFSLYIADDDGEVELEWEPLDSREPIYKYDFTSLALVEKELPPQKNLPPTIITINIPQQGWHKVRIQDSNLLMKEILKIVIQGRRKKEGRGIEYVLERQNEPGVSIDLEKPLKTMDTLEYCLIRLNSVRGEEFLEDNGYDVLPEILPEILPGYDVLPKILPEIRGHDCVEYRRYKVTFIKKYRANAEVHLDIDGEHLKITPVLGGASNVKQLSLEMQALVHADIWEEKAKGKASFRISYQPTCHSDTKHLDLKCMGLVAREIVDKINAILDFRSGSSSQAARAQERKERKGSKRLSMLS